MSGESSKPKGLNGLMRYRFQKKEGAKLEKSPPEPETSSCKQRRPFTSPRQVSEKFPESPERDSSAPGSPVFSSVKKINPPGTGTSQPEGSPTKWLSKAKLQTLVPASSMSSQSSQDSVSSVVTVPDDDRDVMADVATLKQMFPHRSREEILTTMAGADNDLERAINFMMDHRLSLSGIATTTPAKKRQASACSSPDVVVKKPCKRARIISSDEDSGDDTSQGPNGQVLSGSQTSVGHLSVTSSEGDGVSQDAMGFLRGAFPLLPRQILVDTLKKCNNDTDEASSKLSQMCENGQTKNTGSIKAMKDARTIAIATGHGANHAAGGSGHKTKVLKKQRKFNGTVADLDSDDNYEENDGDSSEEEYLEEQEDDAPGEKRVIIKFLNEASLSDLVSIQGCSKKKAENILKLRPFNGWDHLVSKFNNCKLLSLQLVSECKALLRIRNVVQKLMKKCEQISQEIDNVISDLTSNAELDLETADTEYIKHQPKILNQDMKLTPYQLVGLNWLVVMHEQELNGILGDEMGLGKTIQTIAFFAQMKEQGVPGPHIVIAPSSTLDNWLRELQLWCPSLKVLLYYGSQEERYYLRRQIQQGEYEEFDVAVTTYNMASGSTEDRNLFKKFAWNYAVFDEGHMLKNMTSMRYQALMRINAERRLLLTGTPLQNNLIELMSLLAFVMPDLFTSKTDSLKRIFASMTGKSGDERRSSYEAENIGHAQRILRPFFLRRKKVDVLRQLPPKVDKTHHVQLTYGQQKLYNSLRDKFSQTMKENEKNVMGQSGAAMMMSLRRAANHPMLHRVHYDVPKLRLMARQMLKEPTHTDSVEEYVFEDMEVMSDFELHRLCKQYRMMKKFVLDENIILESGKFRFLDEMLPPLKEEGSRVLLFSQFTMMMDILEVYMNKRDYKFIRLDGQTPVAERIELIDSYNNDTSIFVFLLSTKAGGLGINLTAANIVILHDIDFNPYNDKQAEDRCHRLGQKREVKVHRLLCSGTIEEGMWKCAQAKLNLEKDVTGTSAKVSEDTNDVASLIKEALTQGPS